MTRFRRVTVDLVFRLIIVASLLGSLMVYINQENLSNCVAQWANNYTTTASIRSDANNQRLNTLHKLLLDAVESPTQATAAKDQIDLLTALAADNDKLIQTVALRYATDLESNSKNSILLTDVENFVNTERNYASAIKNHPIPDPPKEVC